MFVLLNIVYSVYRKLGRGGGYIKSRIEGGRSRVMHMQEVFTLRRKHYRHKRIYL